MIEITLEPVGEICDKVIIESADILSEENFDILVFWGREDMTHILDELDEMNCE